MFTNKIFTGKKISCNTAHGRNVDRKWFISLWNAISPPLLILDYFSFLDSHLSHDAAINGFLLANRQPWVLRNNIVPTSPFYVTFLERWVRIFFGNFQLQFQLQNRQISLPISARVPLGKPKVTPEKPVSFSAMSRTRWKGSVRVGRLDLTRAFRLSKFNHTCRVFSGQGTHRTCLVGSPIIAPREWRWRTV